MTVSLCYRGSTSLYCTHDHLLITGPGYPPFSSLQASNPQPHTIRIIDESLLLSTAAFGRLEEACESFVSPAQC